MDLIYYCPTFFPENSGYSNAFTAYLKAIAKIPEINITVVTTKQLGDKKEIDLGANVKIQRIYLSKSFSFAFPAFFIAIVNSLFASKYVNSIAKDNDSIIFVETFEDVYFLAAIKKKLFKKTIVRIHAATETECFYFFKGISFKIGRFIIDKFISKRVINIASTNNFHIDFAKKFYFKSNVELIASKRFFVIPNTLLNDLCAQNNEQNSGETLKICTLGRMNNVGFLQKGFDDIISLLLYLKDSLKGYNIDYTIVGSGEYDYKIKKLIEKENFTNIRLLQNITNKETLELLSNSDVVILPSRFEGMSMFALESLAMGNLLLFSNTGGLSDLINEGVNGYKFEPQNLENLIDVFEKVVRFDKNRISKMKNESSLKYISEFSPNIICAKSEKIFTIIYKTYINEQ